MKLRVQIMYYQLIIILQFSKQILKKLKKILLLKEIIIIASFSFANFLKKIKLNNFIHISCFEFYNYFFKKLQL